VHSRMISSSLGKLRQPHSVCKPITYTADNRDISIVPIPILQDNYGYLIVDHSTGKCAAVDPADPYVVLDAVERMRKDSHPQIQLTHILTTHKHWDHAGGNEILKNLLPNLVIVGGVVDNVLCVTAPVWNGDSVRVGNIDIAVLSAVCHTRGHVMYRMGRILFTGDTLFLGGCGQFFEGTANEMYDVLYQKIGKLDDDTLVFPGHEYSVQNLEFASLIDPNNRDLLSKLNWCRLQRQHRQATIPSSLAEERLYNPFLRVSAFQNSQLLSELVGPNSEDMRNGDLVGVLMAIRKLKNDGSRVRKLLQARIKKE